MCAMKRLSINPCDAAERVVYVGRNIIPSPLWPGAYSWDASFM